MASVLAGMKVTGESLICKTAGTFPNLVLTCDKVKDLQLQSCSQHCLKSLWMREWPFRTTM